MKIMGKSSVLRFLCILWASSVTSASYAGPFLLWGMESLKEMKSPTLQAIDDKSLRDVYASASSIVVFIRNSTTELNHENFPRLSEIIESTEWLYLPQKELTSDPLEYNVNAEVFVLTGPVEQQDVEIAALYRDAQVNYGQKNILGVLATRRDHVVYKREAASESSTTELPSTEETPVENSIYDAKGKGLVMVKESPVLRIKAVSQEYELKQHSSVNFDERPNGEFRVIVKILINDKMSYVKFIFNILGDSWSMNQIEVEHPLNTKMVLDVVGDAPSAPLNFSYACGGTFVYRNNGTSLTLKGIQVQPKLETPSKFSVAFDCVGVLTPAIASGFFVTAIIGIALTIAITAILDIKTPNKFENRSSKQLTFTVQE